MSAPLIKPPIEEDSVNKVSVARAAATREEPAGTAASPAQA